MRKIDADDHVNYLFPSELSYLDNDGEDVILYVNNRCVGLIKVWTDKEDNREYICINSVNVYLNTLVER